MDGFCLRRALPWSGLACIFVVHVVLLIRLHPTGFFGLTRDDAVYFSSAHAIAQGRGYILPSLPGTPPATKYPILYPWILSWVWRWNPSFPANVPAAIAINVAFSLSLLTLAFMFLRRLKGISDPEALLLTVFCASQPVLLFYTANVLSDIPFSALALAAMFVADSALQPRARKAGAVGCGILVGLSMLMRGFGVPVATGIVVAGAVRRAWRQMLIFLGCVIPFFAGLTWSSIFPTPPATPVTGAAASSFGWIRMWTYYTSYLGAWKIAVPNAHVLWAMLRNNAGAVLHAPGDYFVDPLFAGHVLTGRILGTLVTAAVLASILRQSRQQEWRPIYVILPFYAALILFWNYADAGRFLLPFLPLFAAGLWLEGKHFLAQAHTNMTSGHPMKERIAAVALGLVIVASGCTIARGYVDGMRKGIAFESEQRSVLLRAKRGAYAWLVRSTPPGVRVIAYEDASLYLHTGRIAMAPFMFTTDELYEPARVGETLAHATDVARVIGAEYWVFADDDFGFEWADRPASANARMSDIERVLPLVYRSPDGRVRVRSLGCIQHPNDGSCQSAVCVLFPTDLATCALSSPRNAPAPRHPLSSGGRVDPQKEGPVFSD